MTIFVIVMAVVLGVDLLGRACAIAKGAPPERSYGAYLLDALLHVCLLGWAIGLLARGA